MITTVTLNTAIDKTYFLKSFKSGQINRVHRMYSEPGGKGLNVAKVLHTLGVNVFATGFVGGFNGNYIETRLDQLGLKHQFVTVDGEARLCLNVVDEAQGAQTEILESGPTIGSEEWKRLQELIEELAAKSEFVIFSGSLPMGLRPDAYAQLIRIAHRQHAKAVLDTSGTSLMNSLSEKPFMVKPNREELAALMNTDWIDEQTILEVMKEWGGRGGIPLVIVSLGNEGSLISYKGTFFKVIPPEIEVVNPVGCGDTLVAGVVAGLLMDQEIEEALVLATSAAAANALERRAGVIDMDQVNRLKAKVHIERIAGS